MKWAPVCVLLHEQMQQTHIEDVIRAWNLITKISSTWQVGLGNLINAQKNLSVFTVELRKGWVNDGA